MNNIETAGSDSCINRSSGGKPEKVRSWFFGTIGHTVFSCVLIVVAIVILIRYGYEVQAWRQGRADRAKAEAVRQEQLRQELERARSDRELMRSAKVPGTPERVYLKGEQEVHLQPLVRHMELEMYSDRYTPLYMGVPGYQIVWNTAQNVPIRRIGYKNGIAYTNELRAGETQMNTDQHYECIKLMVLDPMVKRISFWIQLVPDPNYQPPGG